MLGFVIPRSESSSAQSCYFKLHYYSNAVTSNLYTFGDQTNLSNVYELEFPRINSNRFCNASFIDNQIAFSCIQLTAKKNFRCLM